LSDYSVNNLTNIFGINLRISYDSHCTGVSEVAYLRGGKIYMVLGAFSLQFTNLERDP
jgi:hypothetical protein